MTKVAALAVGMRSLAADAGMKLTTDHPVSRVVEQLETAFQCGKEHQLASTAAEYLGSVHGGAALEVRVHNAGSSSALTRSFQALRNVKTAAIQQYRKCATDIDNLIVVIPSANRATHVKAYESLPLVVCLGLPVISACTRGFTCNLLG